MPTTFANTIDNNEILAKRSQCDYAGNDIQTTYATKSELPSASQLVPTSTPADASKVLTVDSQGIPGWAVVSASDVFVAKYNTTTWTDVSTAYADGKVIFLEVTDASIPYPYRLSSTAQIPLAAIRTGSVGGCAVFIGSSLGTTTGTGENTSWPVYILSSNNTWRTQTRRAYPSFTSSDYNKVLTVVNDGSNFPVLQWSATQSGGVTDVEVDGVSVVSQGVASITTPTVDQVYDGTSTNAQSGVAVAEAIATKEDAFDVGTGLEMDTSGSTPTLQVEAPVDIVAGTGIVIDNPDGNTLRVSVAQDVEVVLYSNNGAAQLPQSTVTLSENASNFEKVVVMYRDRFNNITNSTTFYTDNLTFAGEPTSRIFLSAPFLYESANPILARCSQYKFTAGNTLTFESCGNMLYTTTGVTCSYYTAANNQGTFIYKVVGVHRIAGGN